MEKENKIEFISATGEKIWLDPEALKSHELAKELSFTKLDTFKVRDQRERGWYWKDNDYINGMGKYLGPVAIAVYDSLCRHADKEQRCYPSQDLIAEEIGANSRTVRRYLKKLQSHNVIAIKREKGGRRWAQNVYWLMDKSVWLYPKNHQRTYSPVIKTGVSEDKNDLIHRTQSPTKETNGRKLINTLVEQSSTEEILRKGRNTPVKKGEVENDPTFNELKGVSKFDTPLENKGGSKINPPLDFSFNWELHELWGSAHPTHQVAHHFFKVKDEVAGLTFKNQAQFDMALKPVLALAKKLVMAGYSVIEIKRTINYCADKWPREFNLQTIIKKIPEVIRE